MKNVRVVGFNEINSYKVKHVINTTSKSKNWSQKLSPFFLGPVSLYDNHVAQNVENAWQFSKVYEVHTDQNNEPTNEYYDWAKKGWSETFAHRYPMGKGQIPLYSLWKGQKLDYIEARKQIYAPVYAKAVVKTDAFQKLLDLHLSGDSYVLLDFDGYDYLKENKSLKQVSNDPSKKMGHAFVLAMLLQYPELRKKYGVKK